MGDRLLSETVELMSGRGLIGSLTCIDLRFCIIAACCLECSTLALVHPQPTLLVDNSSNTGIVYAAGDRCLGQSAVELMSRKANGLLTPIAGWTGATLGMQHIYWEACPGHDFHHSLGETYTLCSQKCDVTSSSHLIIWQVVLLHQHMVQGPEAQLLDVPQLPHGV